GRDRGQAGGAGTGAARGGGAAGGLCALRAGGGPAARVGPDLPRWRGRDPGYAGPGPGRRGGRAGGAVLRASAPRADQGGLRGGLGPAP
ncbi:MAG: hypothetical protein AVDCRST_MAG15-2070, partial [uncultured Rubellimicrobium sp.]